MTLAERYTSGERAVFAACAYLAFLSISVVVMWWLALVGGNPFVVQNIGTQTISGAPSTTFHAGDILIVRRRICADYDVAAQFFPRLVSSDGVSFHLTGTMAETPKGCSYAMTALSLPANLPPGKYRYSSLAKFQNNLVGRDEYTVFPPLQIEVLP